jgi:hypothetical protein
MPKWAPPPKLSHREELISSIQHWGFTCIEHAASMVRLNKAVKIGPLDYRWTEPGLMGMTTPDLEMLLKTVIKANQEMNWKLR